MMWVIGALYVAGLLIITVSWEVNLLRDLTRRPTDVPDLILSVSMILFCCIFSIRVIATRRKG